MTYTLSPHLWLPQRRGVEQTIECLKDGKNVCLYAPCGGGKTEQAIELTRWALDWGLPSVSFYTNRRLLVEQTAKRFEAAGLRYGLRAAGYDDYYDPDAPVQICSTQTVFAREYKRSHWDRHSSGLVIVDENHLQKRAMIRAILKGHREHHALTVGMTATPIGVSELADALVISGTLQEYRDCKAVVPAITKSIEQPDLRKVKRTQTGEYLLDGRHRRVYTQSIVGNVFDRWQRYNPEARPTLLYAPGVAESRWFTDQFMSRGIAWAHVDAAEAVVDGRRARLTRPLWEEIQERYVNGDIKGISSRFKTREGLDLPSTYHIILATPIGSVCSYLQAVGRGLRWSPQTPSHVLITDHGGCYWQHGSPNIDRPWETWWQISEREASSSHIYRIREEKEREPIRCPKCEGERLGGSKCPHCGFEHTLSRRVVVMFNGRMVIRDGALIRPRKEDNRPGCEKLWTGTYWGWKKKIQAGGMKPKTFRQLYGYIHYRHGYWLPRTLPFMPKKREDWQRGIHEVPFMDLHLPANWNH